MRRSFWILLAGTAFGSSVVMTRFAVAEIPPIVLVAVRLATAAVSRSSLRLWERRSWESRSALRWWGEDP